MGMNYGAVLLSDCKEKDISGIAEILGIIPPNTKSCGQGSCDSLSESLVGITNISGWGVILCDSGIFIEREEIVENLSENLSTVSKECRLFFWLTQSVTGGLWFEYYENGESRRKWLEMEGEVIENEGIPLPQEPEGFFNGEEDEEGERDEEKLLELADAVTGITTEEIFASTFTLYRNAL